MSLPFELDQADSLVVTKEECLSVSKYKAYRLLYFLLCLLWAKTDNDSEMSCECVSALQRANIKLSSNLLRSYAAVAWIKEMKCWYFLHCIPNSYWSLAHKHTVGLLYRLSVKNLCEQWNRLLCTRAKSEILPTIHFSGLSELAFT